jgi:O-antigen/teichoic acid export membrane protein
MPIMKFYGLDADGHVLYWALLAGFFMSSLKTIPSVFLERSVQFHKIVLVQIIENTVFYIAVIIMAISGYGLLSFAYAVLLRAIVGLIAIYRISPWMPRVGIVRASFNHLLAYGVPFQSMSFLALFKDELVNLFLGKIVGFEVLGYIGWAKKWAESSLRIVMDNISKVVFPLFSRLQGDSEKQKSVMNTILKYQSMVMIPASLGMMMLMPLIVDVLPQYEKWRPALPIFYIFVASSLFSSYSTPFINYFNGIGKVRLSLGFMVMWTVLTWVLLVPLSRMYGMFGFPLTVLILSMTCFLVVLKARQFIAFDFFGIVSRYMLSGILMVVALFAVRSATMSLGLLGIGLVVCAGILVYYLSLRLIFDEDLLVEARSLLGSLK